MFCTRNRAILDTKICKKRYDLANNMKGLCDLSSLWHCIECPMGAKVTKHPERFLNRDFIQLKKQFQKR